MLTLFTATACDHVHPLVANGYSKNVTVTSVDEEGQGGYLHDLAPGQCLEVIHPYPKLRQIIVASPDQQKTAYDHDDMLKATKKADESNGVFVVSETGLAFVPHYKCSRTQ